jgi:hypothetical protein
MEKSLYICVGKQPVMVNLHTNTAYCVSSCDQCLPLGCLPKHIKGVRSLFVQ